MAKSELKPGDPCPRCGGAFVALKVPTDAEYRKAFDRELAPGLPEGTDTASPDQRAELGPLFQCAKCGYATRYGAELAAAAPDLKTKRPA